MATVANLPLPDRGTRRRLTVRPTVGTDPTTGFALPTTSPPQYYAPPPGARSPKSSKASTPNLCDALDGVKFSSGFGGWRPCPRSPFWPQVVVFHADLVHLVCLFTMSRTRATTFSFFCTLCA